MEQKIINLTIGEIISKLEELDRLKQNSKPLYHDNTNFTYHDNGTKRSKSVFINEKLHSYNDDPAYTEWDENGNLLEEKWYKDGLLHRNDSKPAIIKYKNNKIYIGEWYLNGSIRQDLIGAIEYDENGGQSKQVRYNNNGCKILNYYSNGQFKSIYFINDPNYNYNVSVPHALHSDNGPAYVGFYPDGKKSVEKWYQNNMLHREDGPAHILYDEQGNKQSEFWYIKGNSHRKDNLPSSVYYCPKTKRIILERWLEGYELYSGEPKRACVISYYSATGTTKEMIFKKNKDHKAVITFNEEGKKISKQVTINNKPVKTISYH